MVHSIGSAHPWVWVRILGFGVHEDTWLPAFVLCPCVCVVLWCGVLVHSPASALTFLGRVQQGLEAVYNKA